MPHDAVEVQEEEMKMPFPLEQEKDRARLDENAQMAQERDLLIDDILDGSGMGLEKLRDSLADGHSTRALEIQVGIGMVVEKRQGTWIVVWAKWVEK